MQRFERFAVVWSIAYMAVYLPFFIFFCATAETSPFPKWFFPRVISPLHVLGMVQILFAVGLVLRDIYRRPFPEPKQKQTWAKWIIVTDGWAYIAYYFIHGRNARPTAAEDIAPRGELFSPP